MRRGLAVACLLLVLHLQGVHGLAMLVEVYVDRSGVGVLEARVEAVLPEQPCGWYWDLYTMWSINPGFRSDLTEEVRLQMSREFARLCGSRLAVAKLAIDYVVEELPSGCVVRVRVHAIIEGVWRGNNTVSAKFRLAKLDSPIRIGGFEVVPSNTFFLDFTPFSKPLGDWEKIYNGTHTIFRLHLDSVELEARGGIRVPVDPEMVIVVPGYAVGAGDTIVFEQPLTTVTVTRTVTVTQHTTKTITETVTETVTVTVTSREETATATRVARAEPSREALVAVLGGTLIGAVVVMLAARKSAERKKYVRVKH